VVESEESLFGRTCTSDVPTQKNEPGTCISFYPWWGKVRQTPAAVLLHQMVEKNVLFCVVRLWKEIITSTGALSSSTTVIRFKEA